MAWAGVGYAIYGMFALAFDPLEILWREKTGYIGSLTATFINRNTERSPDDRFVFGGRLVAQLKHIAQNQNFAARAKFVHIFNRHSHAAGISIIVIANKRIGRRLYNLRSVVFRLIAADTRIDLFSRQIKIHTDANCSQYIRQVVFARQLCSNGITFCGAFIGPLQGKERRVFNNLSLYQTRGFAGIISAAA